MPPSKYERELRFVDTEVARLRRELDALAASMPAGPEEARAKEAKALEIQDAISALLRRKKEIEDSFIAAGMDVPDIGRSMNATVHNAGAYEVHSREEAEALAATMSHGSAPAAAPDPAPPAQDLDAVTAEIQAIGAEIVEVEFRMAGAEIEGDEAERERLGMMACSLRSRRSDLVARAKELRAEAEAASEEEPAEPAAAADPETERRVAELESDVRSLRSQVSGVRTDVQDVKDQLRRIMAALGIEEDDRGGIGPSRRPSRGPPAARRPAPPRTPRRRPGPAAPWRGTPPCSSGACRSASLSS